MDSSTSSAGDAGLQIPLEALNISDSSNKKQLRVFALDYSGSTGGSQNYFSVARKYLDNFAKEHSSNEPIYLLWDDTCKLATEDDIRWVCAQLKGHGGTSPSKIVKWIVSNYPKEQTDVELWLITDGEIDGHELSLCASLNENVSYSRMRFVVIEAWPGSSQTNLSVGAAFFSGSQVELFLNEKLLKKLDTSKPFEYGKINIDNFDTCWDELSDFIKFKFMGSDRQSLEALKEVELLKKLNTRLLREFSEQQAQLNEILEDKKFPNFSNITTKKAILAKLKELEFYKVLTDSGQKDFRQKIDSGISTLINYIHNKECRSYGYDSLKINFKCEKLKTVETEAEPELDSLKDATPCKFFDAVTLEEEDGTPVLLLNITDLVQKHWIDQSYTKFRAILDCPLYSNVEGCVGHVYSYETFKSLCDPSRGFYLTDPLSREQVCGGLIFSKNADAWNDFVLSKTFFRGKKFHTCLPLWYFLIYKHASQKEWIEADVIQKLKTYCERRMSEVKVPLALGTLPLDPKEMVPLHVALYYCTEGSARLFGEHVVLFSHERLRMYFPVAEDMIQILDVLGGIDDGVDKEFVQGRATALRLVNQLKRIPQKTEKTMFLLQKVFKVSSDGFMTNEVQDSTALKYFNLLQYSHKEMIPFDVLQKPFMNLEDLVVLPYQFEINKNITISRKTCRPQFVVKDAGGKQVSYYRELKEYVKKVSMAENGQVITDTNPVKKVKQDRLVSHCKLYIDLTADLKKFPTWEEYVEYAKKRYRTLGKDEKIYLHFPNVVDHLQHFFQMYSNLQVDLQDFLVKSVKSISTLQRLHMEDIFRGQNEQKFVQEERSSFLN